MSNLLFQKVSKSKLDIKKHDFELFEAASTRFFGKHCSELNVQESAVLVGLLKANTYYNPRLNPENAVQKEHKLRAISHPMRIAIIGLLSNGNKLSVTDIYQSLDIEQATASHHLSILKNKGVLVSKRDGKKIYYALRSLILTEIIDCVNRCNDF